MTGHFIEREQGLPVRAVHPRRAAAERGFRGQPGAAPDLFISAFGLEGCNGRKEGGEAVIHAQVAARSFMGEGKGSLKVPLSFIR